MQYGIQYPDYQGYYYVTMSDKDILNYELFKRFNIRGYTYDWELTQEAKEYVAQFNQDWFKGNIHLDDYYTTLNYDFLKFLSEMYRNAMEDEVKSEAAQSWWDSLSPHKKHMVADKAWDYDEDDDPDDWWDDLTSEDKVEIYEEN